MSVCRTILSRETSVACSWSYGCFQCIYTRMCMPVRVTIVSVLPHATAGSQRALCSSDSGSEADGRTPVLPSLSSAHCFCWLIPQTIPRLPTCSLTRCSDRTLKKRFFDFFPLFCFCFVCLQKHTHTVVPENRVYFQAPTCTCVEQTVSSKVYCIFFFLPPLFFELPLSFVLLLCVLFGCRDFFTFSFFLFFLKFSR